MADVLVAVMPFAGHVAPVTAAVRALLEAGHRVRVHAGSAYAGTFAELGAEVVPWREAPDFDERDLTATFPQVGRGGPRGLLLNVEHVFVRSATGQVADLLAAFERRPWDVLLADSLSLGAALAAERTATPWATLSVVPLSMVSRDLPPPNLPVAPARGPLGRVRDRALRLLVAAATGSLRRAYRQTRVAVGLPARGKRLTDAFFSPFLVLALGIAELEAPRSDLPAQVHFIGAFPPPATTAGLPDRPAAAGAGPLVHVTQGTFDLDHDRVLRPALDALADRPVRVLATTGIRGRDALPFAVPANAVVAGLVSYAELLPRTSVMITNGGWGGVLAALAHGVPLVVAGADLDKPMIAAAVARSGAGIDLRTGRPTRAAISRALDRLDADPSFRRRATELADRFRAHDTAAELVALLDRLIATGAPVLRAGSAWGDPQGRR